MKFGICTTPFIPLRGRPADSSEMVTSLLFGETFKILESKGNWHFIKMTFDSYEGWLFGRNIEKFDENSQLTENQSDQYLVAQPFQMVFNNNNRLYLGLGTPLPFFDGKYCFLKGESFQLDTPVFEITRNRENSLQIAERFLGTPYLWGGRSSFGIDCSGFTQILMRYSGVQTSRDAKDQINEGKTIDSLMDSKEGDLAFFKNKKGKIIHSGLLTSANKIIHASEKVRKDTIDEQGIWNAELENYTHTLAGIRGFLQ